MEWVTHIRAGRLCQMQQNDMFVRAHRSFKIWIRLLECVVPEFVNALASTVCVSVCVRLYLTAPFGWLNMNPCIPGDERHTIYMIISSLYRGVQPKATAFDQLDINWINGWLFSSSFILCTRLWHIYSRTYTQTLVSTGLDERRQCAITLTGHEQRP